MASIEVKVPQLSESVAEATLLQWHKKVGEAVARDENLIDIETDKVVLELPAPSAGVITEIRKADGATVVAGEVIAVLDTDGKAGAAPPPAAPAPARGRARARRRRPHRPRPPPPSAAAAPPAGSGGIAMPSAAKLLAEKGIDPSQVAGTGRDGRITKGDALGATAPPRARAARRRLRSRAGRRVPRRHPHRQADLVAAGSQAAGRPQGAAGRPSRAAGADVAPAPAGRGAAAAVAGHQRDPDDLQRSQHAAGHGAAQEVPGPLREGARRAPGLHELLREGGRPCA